MYGNLTPPLVVLLAAALSVLAFLLLRRPVLRRLALRQVNRRRAEAALVVIGSALGTTIIVASLVVGDTLNFSVKQDAYRTLGPVDERVISTDPVAGELVALALDNLRSDPYVDGVLTAHSEQAAAVFSRNGRTVAEPRTLVWDLDFEKAQRFGGKSESAKLPTASPGAGQVFVNDALAGALGARVGDDVTLYIYGKPTVLRIARVLPTRGLTGIGFGDAVNRDAFVAPESLLAAGVATGKVYPRTVTFVSNLGGVESGNRYSTRVAAHIRDILAPLSAAGTAVDTPKKDVLAAAKKTGDTLGALFLFIGSFSIIAGVLLLVNIFVMLGEERKNQLGMLRAVGMKRSRLVGTFVAEGALYALLASVLGTVAGLGVGRAVATIAANIFRGMSASGTGLDIKFAVTPISLINGFALGLLIAVVTVLLTSMRISRLNIIAAIRDLPTDRLRRLRVRYVVASTVLSAALALAAVVAVARGKGYAVYLMPALALLFAVPLLSRYGRRRWVNTVCAAAVLLWVLTANLVRPHIYDDSSMTTYIVLGVLLTFSAVLLLTENQNLVLRPLRPVIESPTQTGLSTRLAVAYPLARKFRTGATLIMYSIVVFTIVLIVQINAVIASSVDTAVAQATAGYSIRVDYNANNPVVDPTRTLREGEFAGKVAAVAPLTVVTAGASDPGHRTTAPLAAAVIGLPAESLLHGFKLGARLDSTPDDAAVWTLLARDDRYVVLDRYFGTGGGPPGQAYKPGDTFWLTDPRTGHGQQKIIAGLLDNGMSFYGVGFLPATDYPVIMTATAVRDQFGSAAVTSSALLQVTPGTDESGVRAAMQGKFLSSSLVATSIGDVVKRQFAGSRGLFHLMAGFIALGLIVCITGLGVIMVRAVRERRRTIGVLRALGFRAKTVQRSFLTESSFVALEGIVLGAGLSLLTTYLLVHNSTAFEGLDATFAVDWPILGLIVVGTFVASLLVTATPARRAAHILPALAVRVDG